MSKPPSKPRASEPARGTATPPPGPSRKVSQPSKSPKFYDGPTVKSKAQDAAGKAKVVASETAAVAKVQSRKAAAKVRRHPWGFASLISTIPFLLVLSLFSTVLCPPPAEPQSTFSRLFTAPLGLSHPSTESQLHKTLCYPANIYHRDVLKPYVYPALDDAQKRLAQHPLYTSTIQPTYVRAKKTGRDLWEGPIRPVVDRTVRGARRFYLTFVEPHLPYFQATYHKLADPYTARIAALHQAHVAPHIATGRKIAAQGWKRADETYRYAASHPFTSTANKYANAGYAVASRKSHEAYVWSRPHAIRFGREAERVAREVLGPRAIRGLAWSADQAAKGWAVVKQYATDIYIIHLEPHVGPYVSKVSTFASPYAATFRTKVYQPYLVPAFHTLFPALVAPEPPKNFWSLIADFLPSVGSHPAETKGKMDDYYANLDKVSKPGQVPVPDAAHLADKPAEPPLPPPHEAKADKKAREQAHAKSAKLEKEEMNRVREAVKERVEKQGANGYEQVKEQILSVNRELLAETIPKLSQNARSELERDMDYVVKGLDKLYSNSPSLTKDQVKTAGDMAEARVGKTVQKVKERVEKQKTAGYDNIKSVVKSQSVAVEKALGHEHADLGKKMAWMDDVSSKDWDKYHALGKSVSAWKDKYAALHEGKAADKQIKTASTDVTKALNSITSDINDIFEAFKERLAILRRTAYDRIDARNDVSSSSTSASASASASSSSSTSASSSSSSSSKGRASILPIVEAAEAANAGAGIIGKGKEQVLEALSQASAAVAGETASSGIVDQVKASASSVFDAASSSVHDATRSAIKAAGATPSPESPREHVESVLHAASDAASSAYDAAGSVVHDATRSAIKAVGATPSPESLGEHVESFASAATASAESVYSAASSSVSSGASVASETASSLVAEALLNLHHATRSIISAAGATPSPEGMKEHLESIVAGVAQGAASVYGVIEENVHHATRSVISAAGGTPEPESPLERAQSFAAAVSSTASSLVAEATKSAVSIGGVVSESAESVYSAVADSGASIIPTKGEGLVSSASSAIHSATREAIKAVGATPSPESPAETLESIASVASASASSAVSAAGSAASEAGGAVSAQAVLLSSSIRSALGLVSEPTPLASSASAYLASLSSAGASLGTEALASGEALLAALRSNAASLAEEASSGLHQATRSVSKAVGATPSPETPGEYVEDMQRRVDEARRDAESLVRKHASRIAEEVGTATEKVKQAVTGKDEL